MSRFDEDHSEKFVCEVGEGFVRAGEGRGPSTQTMAEELSSFCGFVSCGDVSYYWWREGGCEDSFGYGWADAGARVQHEISKKYSLLEFCTILICELLHIDGHL